MIKRARERKRERVRVREKERKREKWTTTHYHHACCWTMLLTWSLSLLFWGLDYKKTRATMMAEIIL